MDRTEIERFIDLFSQHGLTRLSMEVQGFHLEIEKELANREKLVEITEDNKDKLDKLTGGGDKSYLEVRSPMVGIFYSSLSPSSPRLASEGDWVEKGDTLFVIEAMKMINEVKSPVAGWVRKIHFQDESLLEYDDLVMEIEEDV